jgi:hypothetical protein
MTRGMTLWPDEVDEMLATAKALADRLERIVNALDEMGAEADRIGWSAFDMCDCGHRRNVHRDPRYGKGSRCLVDGCGCDGWDDTHQRVEAELKKRRERGRDELARRRAERSA